MNYRARRQIAAGVALLLFLGGAAIAGDPGADGAAAPDAAVKLTARELDPRVEKIEGKLQAFCVKWMGFLEVRERDNRAAIAWQAGPDGIKGEFVGYSSDYECVLKNTNPDVKTSVGTIKYIEYRYRHAGPSRAAALERSARIIEATEVVEIFRYGKNKWIY